MKIQSIIRNFCMICVPLFMMITGFLNKKTEYNKSFFKGLFNVLIVWLFYSLIEYITLNLIHGNINDLNLRNLMFSITSFNACGYSWYIEMYIGLYLISPVINNAYNSFNKKNKAYLFIISICAIILPNFINAIFSGILYIPNWWSGIYPITYYICGKYIYDVNPKFKKKTLLILLILAQIITISYNYISGIDFNTFPTFINTVLIFLLFYNLNIKNIKLQKIITYISNISLDIYLASSLIDKLVYPIFNSKLDSIGVNQQYSILYAPIVLVIIFIFSIIYGSIRKLIINVR